MALDLAKATALFDQHLAQASRGDAQSYFELGIAYSTGTDGCAIDLIEAHKWFNLAALSGVREGAVLRAEVAAEMGRDEIAEAQRGARAWLSQLQGGSSAQRYAA